MSVHTRSFVPTDYLPPFLTDTWYSIFGCVVRFFGSVVSRRHGQVRTEVMLSEVSESDVDAEMHHDVIIIYDVTMLFGSKSTP
jgi:hypothetical protein